MRLRIVSVPLLSLSLSLVANSAVPPPKWTLVKDGMTGISALEVAVVSPNLVLILDKLELNPLQFDGHSAWGELFNLITKENTPLNVTTDSFCAGGAFLSNGTLVSAGGDMRNNPQEFPDNLNVNGVQGLRLFDPCDDPTGATCTLFEDPPNLHIAAPRWYPAVTRIFDGSVMISGGSSINGFYNANATNSIEFFPPKDGGVPRHSPFLNRTLPANLFPLTFPLPDGRVFMASNNQTIIYDVETNTEEILPEIPNGVRVTTPFTGSGALLPLSPPDYTPEILICGGSNISDALNPLDISSQTPASNQCNRMTITPEGIKKGWEVDFMLDGRMMPETVLMPNGQILIINGAHTGASGYLAVADSPGSGNADHPAFTPQLYTPSAPLGSRFTNRGMPTSDVPRVYHSTATFTPQGNFFIAGSNANMDVNTTIEKFPTIFQVEFLNPPWMFVARPQIMENPAKIGFGELTSFKVNIPRGLNTNKLTVSLMDLGFTTHAVHVSSRMVHLVAHLLPDRQTLLVTGPPTGRIYPPGPGFIFIVVDDVVSEGVKVMIGTGEDPPIAGI